MCISKPTKLILIFSLLSLPCLQSFGDLLDRKFISVSIFGDIQAPGMIEVENGTSLIQLIYYVGGLRFNDEITIRIKLDDGRTEVRHFDIGEICDTDGSDVTIEDGWLVLVPNRIFPTTDPETINPKIKAYIKKHYPHFHVIKRGKLQPKASEEITAEE